MAGKLQKLAIPTSAAGVSNMRSRSAGRRPVGVLNDWFSIGTSEPVVYTMAGGNVRINCASPVIVRYTNVRRQSVACEAVRVFQQYPPGAAIRACTAVRLGPTQGSWPATFSLPREAAVVMIR
jgi:hypothetical protein